MSGRKSVEKAAIPVALLSPQECCGSASLVGLNRGWDLASRSLSSLGMIQSIGDADTTPFR